MSRPLGRCGIHFRSLNEMHLKNIPHDRNLAAYHIDKTIDYIKIKKIINDISDLITQIIQKKLT